MLAQAPFFRRFFFIEIVHTCDTETSHPNTYSLLALIHAMPQTNNRTEDPILPPQASLATAATHPLRRQLPREALERVSPPTRACSHPQARFSGHRQPSERLPPASFSTLPGRCTSKRDYDDIGHANQKKKKKSPFPVDRTVARAWLNAVASLPCSIQECERLDSNKISFFVRTSALHLHLHIVEKLFHAEKHDGSPNLRCDDGQINAQPTLILHCVFGCFLLTLA